MMMKGEKVERGDYLEEEPASLENEFSSPMDAFNFDMNFSAPVSEDTMQVGDKLMKLIETGGMYGISFVVSSLEFQTIKDSMFSYGNNAAKNFPRGLYFLFHRMMRNIFWTMFLFPAWEIILYISLTESEKKCK